MSRKRYHLITKESCPYCQRATALLDAKGLNYDTDPMDETPELLQEIKQQQNFNTVPMIWEIDHRGQRTFIGGYGELVQHFMKQDKKLLYG